MSCNCILYRVIKLKMIDKINVINQESPPCQAEVEKGGSLKFFLKKCGLDAKADMPYDKI